MSIVYVTKSVNCNLTSNYDGIFQYPESGMVEAPDWKPEAECGKGLHGFLWGEGCGGLAHFGENSKWLLIKVDAEDGFVELDGKVKFRRGEVVFVGSCAEVAEELKKYLPNDRVYSVIGSTVTGGDRSTVTGGNRSTVTGGDRSTVTGGYGSAVTGGDGSTVTGGDRSTVTGGDRSTVTGGEDSTVTGGEDSTVAGGEDSTVAGGDGSTLIIIYFDNEKGKWRKKIAVVGEDGIAPATRYILDEHHNFVKVN